MVSPQPRGRLYNTRYWLGLGLRYDVVLSGSPIMRPQEMSNRQFVRLIESNEAS